MKKFYFLLFFLCLSVSKVLATHIVGGEFALTSKGRAYVYELSMNLYFDDINGNRGAEDARIFAAIFSKQGNRLITTVILERASTQLVEYSSPDCTDPRLKTRQIRYATEITLSPDRYNDEGGYYVVWERCCRNNDINNIRNPESAGMAFYMEFPAVVYNGNRFFNDSPVFDIPKGDYACVNEPFTFEFSATDADGDQLVYKLATPFKGHSSAVIPNPAASDNLYRSAPYPLVSWASGISINNVIPGSNPLRVNETTGQITFTASKLGLYVFSVVCEEFRDGKKIGEVRRDFQLMVIDCPKNGSPVVKMKESGKAGFYIEGQVLTIPYSDTRCFDLAIIDADFRQQINLTMRPLNFEAGLATLTPQSAFLNGSSDTLRAQLCWDKCAQSKPGEPFMFEIIASDNGCPLPKRDTLLIKMDLQPSPNDPPTITTSLSNNEATLIAGNTLTFTVTGEDMIDKEEIIVEAQARGFDMAKAGMTFTPGTGIGKVTVPLTWDPDCNEAVDNTTYIIDFVVKDKRCPLQQKTDTVTVMLHFEARDTRQPEVITTLQNNYAALFTSQELRFDVIATDPDSDPISLRAVGRGFSLAAVGMQFNNSTGNGKIIEPFYWKPTCENTLSEQGTYIIDFIVEDNSCATNRFDTITVTLTLSDFEVVFEGFQPPNVFTPNGDADNESFYIPNLPADNCKEWFEKIEIYNRWGKLVYEGNKREFNWTGIGFPTGVYYYLIYYHKSRYKGTVSLLR